MIDNLFSAVLALTLLAGGTAAIASAAAERQAPAARPAQAGAPNAGSGAAAQQARTERLGE